jgi:hypothetical protein
VLPTTTTRTATTATGTTGTPTATPSTASTTATSTTATSTTATNTTASTTPVARATYRCDQNIAASTAGTPAKPAACTLAENAFYEVYRHSRGAAVPPASVPVWDPSAGAYVAMRCRATGARIACTAPDGRASTFPIAAVKEYTPALARSFSAGRDLGPRG